MIGVTAFGLVFTPVFYVACRALGERLRRRRRPRRPTSRCSRPNEEADDDALSTCSLCLSRSRWPPARSARTMRRPATPAAAAGAFIGAGYPGVASRRAGRATGGGSTRIRCSTGSSPTRSPHNTDVRVAVAHLARARARACAKCSAGRLPQAGVGAGATYGRVPEARPRPAPTARTGSFDVGLDVAYEVDLFGRVSRSIEAARGDVAAAEAAPTRSASRSSPRPRAPMPMPPRAAERLAVASASSRCSTRPLNVTTRRFEAGRGTRLDVARIAALRDQQRADVAAASRPSATGRCSAWRRSPAARPPTCPPTAGARRTILQLDQPIPVGDGARCSPGGPTSARPSAGSRPTTARIGVATADLYPRITLRRLDRLDRPVARQSVHRRRRSAGCSAR